MASFVRDRLTPFLAFACAATVYVAAALELSESPAAAASAAMAR